MRNLIGFTKIACTALVAADIALVAGCGGGGGQKTGGASSVISTLSVPNSTVPPATSPIPQVTTTLPPVPVTGPDHPYHLAATFTDTKGYTFKLTATLTLGHGLTGNSSQLTPGQKAIVLPFTAHATVTNTSSRTVPYDPVAASAIIALWKAPTALCPRKAAGDWDPNYMLLNGTDYCVAQIAIVHEPHGLKQMAPGQTLTLPINAAQCQSNDGTVVNPGCETIPAVAGNETSWQYPAPAAKKALGVLQQPPNMVLWLGSLEGPQAEHPCYPSDNLGWVAASTARVTSCPSK